MSAPPTAPLRVALLGCGTVGSAVLRLLDEQAGDITARVGRPVEVAGVAVRRPDRHPEVPAHLLTTDAHALVTRDDVDLVVEVIGGIDPARELMLAAFAAGKGVVSANKALLADDGVALHAAAAEAGVDLYYEAAVAGAIPLLRPLRESLAGDQLTRVVGIVNGTTNYILSRMAETGAGFAEALAEATELGYAEADPTADVDGFDAAAKAAILASLAFHTPVTAADVHREGIAAVSATDVARAAEIGCTVKLLAICEKVEGEDGASVAVRVHPAMIPTSHPLASVGGAFNAVFVEAEAAGQLMFYGQGAGGEPTASAVLGDLVAVARNRVAGAAGPGTTVYAGLPVAPMADTPTRYHVSLDVADVPGVLAQVAQEFAAQGVSISTVRQDGAGEAATLVIVTHRAPDSALSATIAALRGMPAVRAVTSVLRVEGLA
ncbi:homoserine dehydrogenase [Klenkia sp. PcliD-1-E]|uniref:homoserine dehydrogenase n=1 Tax=Klenkia sp. PcliD-1-E TaxID=2954492 RepID=UPI002097266E|nr:homoserine dehydrogenase [Klenkia sp. PcliD-1-E]MCO7221810.1 homoserine dehydrogenase [Klenkia sp. PcliD-1-E]